MSRVIVTGAVTRDKILAAAAAFLATHERVYLDQFPAVGFSLDPIIRTLEWAGYHQDLDEKGRGFWIKPGWVPSDVPVDSGVRAPFAPLKTTAPPPIAGAREKRSRKRGMDRFPPLPEPTSEAERAADANNTCAFDCGGGVLCGERRYLNAGWQHNQVDRYCQGHMRMVEPKRFRTRLYH